MGHTQKVLIFQIGSLGDTVIAMPVYREILRRHPNSERYLLTNFPVGVKTVQAEAMLAPCGLIDGAVEYPMPLRGWQNIKALFKRIRALKPDVLYYLCPEKRLANLLRHYTFFKACAIPEIHGMPWKSDERLPRSLNGGLIWESEASRLLRTIAPQRVPGPPPPPDRDLNLTAQERDTARSMIAEVPAMQRFIAVSVGGKYPIKDWGNENWCKVLASLSKALPGLGAVFVGSADERERNELLCAAWAGPKLNSCGRTTPRETAALLEPASLFLGHDTGTLHLAAAVDTRIVGIYCARDFPGKWYSDRPGDRFFYHRPPCFNCQLTQIPQCPNQWVCMTSHKVEEVVAAAAAALGDIPTHAENSHLAEVLKPVH